MAKAPDLDGTSVWLSGRRADVRYDDEALAPLGENMQLESLELSRQLITRLPPLRPQIRKLLLDDMAGVNLDGLERLSGLQDVSLAIHDLDLDKAMRLLAELPDLATLALHGVKAIPASIAKLPSLVSLQLQFDDDVDITSSLAALATCKTLRTLALGGGKKLPPAIGKLRQLRALALSSYDKVPDELFDLVELEELAIDGRRFTSVSPKIGKLVNLVKLVLEETKVTALPETIGKLAALRDVGVPWSRCKVPDSFFALTLDSFRGPRKIRDKLALNPPAEPIEDHVALHDPARIPASLGDPLELWIHMTAERAWPELDKLARIAEVHLDLPNFDEVLPRLADKKYLRTLKLTGEHARFPESLGELVQLASLHLESDLITVLPKSFEKLAHLTALHVASEALTAISLNHLHVLERLVLFAPNLESLGPIGKLAKLRELHLTGAAKLTAIPRDIVTCTSLRFISLRNTRLKPADLVVFGKLPALRELSLSTALPKLETLLDALAGGPLEELSLTSRSLKSLPKSIGKLAKLTRLDVTMTSITTLPKEIAACTELRYVALPNAPWRDAKDKLPPGRWKKGQRSTLYWFERSD